MLADGGEKKQVGHLAQQVEVTAVHHARFVVAVENRQASAEIIDIGDCAVPERDVARGYHRSWNRG